MQIEICTNSFSSAKIAAATGVDRIELCQALELGGLTPSPADIQLSLALRKRFDFKVYVLIRPRPGDFCYSSEELEVMRKDILNCKIQGADGVVLGVLTANAQIDIEALKPLTEAGEGMGLTFHRAFDYVRDAEQSMEKIIDLGFERILTSGQANTAIEGKDFLKNVIEKAGNRISVMPGGGINAGNVKTLVEYTGAKEIHFSAKETIKSSFEYSGGPSLNANRDSEFDYWLTSTARIEEIKRLLRELE